MSPRTSERGGASGSGLTNANGPQVSSRALAMPHSLSFFTVQSAAALVLVDPVSRAPYTSVSQLAISMTCDRLCSSALIRAMAAVSMRSCAASGVAMMATTAIE